MTSWMKRGVISLLVLCGGGCSPALTTIADILAHKKNGGGDRKFVLKDVEIVDVRESEGLRMTNDFGHRLKIIQVSDGTATLDLWYSPVHFRDLEAGTRVTIEGVFKMVSSGYSTSWYSATAVDIRRSGR